jgi:hypothetical protein
MKRYWYFASTLPSFPFGAPPPFSAQEFDALCERLVDKSDRELIQAAGAAVRGEYTGTIEKSPFLKAFFEWERGTRNALAMLRAREFKWDPEPWIRPGNTNTDALQAAQAIHSASDPLQAELTFERERWIAVERLSALSAFELDYILAYKIKLLIATRCISFQRDRGAEGFRIFYQDIVDAAADVASSALDTGVAT